MLSWLQRTFTSSGGRKFIMGLTGFALIGFLIAHLTTNSTILWGAINKRAESGLDFSPDEQSFVRQIATFCCVMLL